MICNILTYWIKWNASFLCYGGCEFPSCITLLCGSGIMKVDTGFASPKLCIRTESEMIRKINCMWCWLLMLVCILNVGFTNLKIVLVLSAFQISRWVRISAAILHQVTAARDKLVSYNICRLGFSSNHKIWLGTESLTKCDRLVCN